MLSQFTKTPLLLFLLLPFFLFYCTTTLASPATGFDLQLIHRDSVHSPLYPGNLTTLELHRRLLNYSRSRLLWLESFANGTGTGTDTAAIRPVVEHVQWLLYIVRLYVGSPGTAQNLLLDTGSSLIWTQCHPCDQCFPQDPPHFMPAYSASIADVPWNHPLCHEMKFARDGQRCMYSQHYNDGSHTHGHLKFDWFTFRSRTGALEHIPRVAFGCSTRTNPEFFPNQLRGIAGILGMGVQPASLPRQLAEQTGGRFSYCLVPPDKPNFSYLRFGDDVGAGGGKRRSTPLFRYDRMPPGYYVKLLDLSFNDHRLYLPHRTFAPHLREGKGGCTVDTGTQYSFVIDAAYQPLRMLMKTYFTHLGIAEINGRRHGYPMDLCFGMPRRFNKFPTVTLHFQGLDLRLAGERLFVIDRDEGLFCLGLLPAETLTMVGAMQQIGMRVTYDTTREVLILAEENCVRN